MAIDHRPITLRCRINIQIPDVVQQQELHAIHHHRYNLRQCLSPTVTVDVTAHRNRRCNLLQLIKNSAGADVTSVKNQITALQCSLSLIT